MKILLFGPGSYIAKHFAANNPTYTFITVGRDHSKKFDYYLDLNDIAAVENFHLKTEILFDAILFCQGMNPTRNLENLKYEHFIQMFNVNIIAPALIFKNVAKHMKKEALCLFFTSIAAQKGSYDPSYASAKAAISGLLKSLANAYPQLRFNSLSLGLVENSTVYEGMTENFRRKHKSKMFSNNLVNIANVCSMINELIVNYNINKASISLDGGYDV